MHLFVEKKEKSKQNVGGNFFGFKKKENQFSQEKKEKKEKKRKFSN